jgi:modulator of FtsH protease
MIERQYSNVATTQQSVLATNKVLRNTYMLLSLTLLFSAATATFAVLTNAPSLGLFSLVIFFGLFFLVNAVRNSIWALPAVFLLTGFMGYMLGPLLSAVLSLSNGGELIATALGGTGVIFLALSGYVLVTRKDFTFMGGFLMVGMLVIFLAVLANFFMAIPALTLALSAAIILLMSGFILYDTSRIIHGGETNYIMATVGLYISIYNIFANLLMILGIFGGDD